MSRQHLVKAAAAAVALLTLAGCEVDPYCLTCRDGAVEDGGFDSGRSDLDGRVVGPRDTGVMPDAGPDGCLEAELCNDLDDDCDGTVDEDFNLNANPEHCGECGNFCRFAHAFATCESGECVLGTCDVPFYDLNEDPSDGCEYRCVGAETEDTICNLRDDDCDGEVDEDVDKMADPVNCGRCGRVCNAPHAAAACDAGECTLGACDEGFHDLNGDPDDGCEYACTPASPADEVCNARDDDCDGMVDEGDPGGGVACGSSEGECAMGIRHCVEGRLECEGATEPTTETCNGADDDCDSRVDEGNPQGGRVCGTSTGLCDVGAEECMGGELVCVGAVDAVAEACNNLDDDCDATVDEGDPEGGAACGETEGQCSAGTRTCIGGALVCTGNTPPTDELCNGLDDDCDTMIDEGNPQAGGICGTDQGRCSTGSYECSGGELVCVGDVGPSPEVCNGQDDDCDGLIDDGNPDGGAACGSSVGACSEGTVMCRSGTLVCEDAVGQTAEICDEIDNDCDTSVDEDFSLTTDVRNCGSCGTVCDLPNASEQCQDGLCAVASCESGFHDLDPAEPGCEYACEFAGQEVCNGEDDDCNGTIDDEADLSPPPDFCNPNGVCADTTASCGGAAGWVCSYPSTYEPDSETLCDGLDNDCDGAVDESYDLLGTSCGNGEGVCRNSGVYVCNDTQDGVECNADPAGSPLDEDCNGRDDDCDGLVDEVGPDLAGTAYRDAIDLSAIDTVAVDDGAGAIVHVMQYEASRPDASAGSPGDLSTLACSRPAVRPWTNVTWDQAQAACCALNESGECPAAGNPGWRLCDAPEWQAACEGPAGACDWSYASSCSTSQTTTCNGAEYDCDATTAGDQDCIFATGSGTFPMCYTPWTAGNIHDLSGNVREWTGTSRGTDGADTIYEVRGGSYNHVEAGRACDWSFTVARNTFAAPNTGFRCCMYE